MSFERGGRGDKDGNRYEDRFFAKLILDLLLEKLITIEVEPLGSEGEGVEFVATAPDGERRYYQCKGSNGVNTKWNPQDLNRHSVFKQAKKHILSNQNHAYYFISPVPYDELDTLCNRARNCHNVDEFFAEQVTNQSLRKWMSHCEIEFHETGTSLVHLLSRCYFELEPMGEEHRRGLESLISLLFVEDTTHSTTTIRILLERFSNDQAYWGKPIYASNVVAWLKRQGIHQRILGQDTRWLPRIQQLNRAYAGRFLTIGPDLIHRTETDEVLRHVLAGTSVIVLGSAGTGKSGCLQEVIQALEKQDVPHLALSLDKSQPAQLADQYGRSLGLPDSPSAALFRIAGEQRCVLIFDQLDALRWTNSRTSSMLDVCKAIIQQAEQFNRWENGKISCIFAVRSFDYETDLGLQNLLESSANTQENQITWEKVTIGPLSDADVQEVIGEVYPKLSLRLRELLRTPSSLYVWSRITGEEKNNVTSLFQLMDAWWKQILSECCNMGVDATVVADCRDRLVTYMRNQETLFAPILLFKDQKPLDALVSCGVLKKDEKSVCFCHQSFLDYALVVDDLNRIFQGKHLPSLIGNMDKQTPDVRYQLLMLLQYLSEFDENMFLKECRGLLDAPDIRYYFRCCAFEVLGQLPTPNQEHWKLLAAYFDESEWRSQIIRTVFWGHPAFIRLLAEQCSSYPWYKQEGRDLLKSIVQADPELAWIILQNANSMTVNELFDIARISTIPSTQIFSLRIQLLINHADVLLRDFGLYDLLSHGYAQAIPVMKAWVALKPDKREHVQIPDETVLKKYAGQYYSQVLDELLTFVLETAARESAKQYRSEWVEAGRHVSAERLIVRLIQDALNKEAGEMPEQFFHRLSFFAQVESPIKPELFLHAIEYLPLHKADEVFDWLLEDFDERAFDETSFENSQLACCRRIIQRFSPHCSITTFTRLEQFLTRWSPNRKTMLAAYQDRIACHKVEGGGNYYGSFWGDLQRILLPALDHKRIANRTKELCGILFRRFPEDPPKFKIPHIGMAHVVSSPIDGHIDRIRDKSWLKLIARMSTNPPDRSMRNWEKGVESTPSMFARSLSTASKKEPVRFAALSLHFPSNVNLGFVDAIVSAITSPEVPLPLTCEVLRRFCRNPSAQMAISFSYVLYERAEEDWPSDILQNLIKIACCHADPEPDSSHLHFGKSNANLCCDDLLQNSANCARGCAVDAIAALLWEHTEYADRFKVVLKHSVEDENPAVLFSVLHCAVAWYNIDKTFSKSLFDRLFARDLRVLGARQAWDLLCLFYNTESEFYAERLKTAMQSPIEDLKKYATEMAATLVIMGQWSLEEFVSLLFNEQQKNVICHQAVIHYQYDEARVYCQQLLQWLMEKSQKLPSLSLLFHNERLEIPRDRNFIVELLGKEYSSIIVGDVLHYLKTTHIDAKDYAEILFACCAPLSEQQQFIPRYHVDDLIFCVVQLFRFGKDDAGVIKRCLDIWDAVYRMYPLSIQPLTDLLEQS